MELFENHSLKPYNTFNIEARAKKFVAVHSVDELQQVLRKHADEPKFFLGGGSNMLLTKDIDALVIRLELKGKRIVHEDPDHVIVEAMCGENWHEFVLWTISQDFGGLENLSLIPGNVGTTPIQNIGAYGTEIKDTFVCCEALSVQSGEKRIFYKEDCKFAYRESVFKNEEKDKYVITSVQFKLSSHSHKINTGYGDIQKQLQRNGVEIPKLKDVSDAVIAIRKSKLPDPEELGNSGSFFKNPILSKEDFDRAFIKFPDMPHYTVSDSQVKIPAGWLIEQAGFKGQRFGDAGVHKNQALVLVNYGGASGAEILALSKTVQQAVFEKFGISIEAEVNVI